MYCLKVLLSLFLLLMSSIKSEVLTANKTIQKKPDSTVEYINFSNNGAFSAYKNTDFSNHRSLSEEPDKIENCGGVFKNIQNLIQSPGYPEKVPQNSHCVYEFISPYICENAFHIQFLDFSIESSIDCKKDKVVINYSDILCGKIIGVKKYKTTNGRLNITFESDSCDSKSVGFQLLVTRLPCIDNDTDNQVGNTLLEPAANPESQYDNRCFNVNSSYSVEDPSYKIIPEIVYGHPVYGIPGNKSERQDIPVYPIPGPVPIPPQIFPPVNPIYPPINPIYPPVNPINPPILPPQFLPQCCRNNYNQRRFLLINNGFPSFSTQRNDCTYVVQKSSENICRLRIVFKYFLLDNLQNPQLGCTDNFLEIDGQRICGCETNFIYETQFDFQPKVIRVRTTPGTFTGIQGFVLDVIQELCPYKIQEPVKIFKKMRSEKLLFKPHSFGRFNINPEYPQQAVSTRDREEVTSSKFYMPESNFMSNNCILSPLKLLQLKLETIGIFKHICLPYKYYSV
ncbi:unnamed protein product [Diamesa serratosioi]